MAISSSLKDLDETQFKAELALEIAESNAHSALELNRQEACQELLKRLYLLSWQLESVEGVKSRLAWYETVVPPDDWQNTARERNNPNYGEAARTEELKVSGLHNDEDFEFVYGLMGKAGMMIDTDMNRREVMRKQSGMAGFRYYDPYLNRAHSIYIVYALISHDYAASVAMRGVADAEQVLERARIRLERRLAAEQAKGAVTKVLNAPWWFCQVRALRYQVHKAEKMLGDAEAEFDRVKLRLRKWLDAGFSQDVRGRHYHLRDDEFYQQREREFYQKFFGRVYPYGGGATSGVTPAEASVQVDCDMAPVETGAQTGHNMASDRVDADEMDLALANYAERQREIDKIVRLRLCLGMMP